ncbi:PREDICTED: uncharacterized protein LOC104826648 isoform X2 [Tarenaya hassleriana]|uniref:uncharacterized protein LOC104826648 isoform X2 n=1 Tax=Tarenaya hassleriana TaxID=28532 RepID=UPI00053C24BC|nr:PREDICTED: uncharacterized protein LOC104826648 isoform X2 [Tarenaya hassleriana]
MVRLTGNAVLRSISSIFLILALVSAFLASAQKQKTVYEVLKAHGLPMGLLPKGVKKFYMDETGRFEAHLDQACNAKFESELHYERNVSGTLSDGQIGELSGISALELYLWFPVKKIRVDVPSSGLIYFDVGVVLKQFSLSLFETPRECVAGREARPENEIGDGDVFNGADSEPSKLRFQPGRESL